MEIDLSDYSIETLIELKDKISGIIYNHNDGYLYICNVRSYGRNWNDNGISNLYTLQELCNQYNHSPAKKEFEDIVNFIPIYFFYQVYYDIL